MSWSMHENKACTRRGSKLCRIPWTTDLNGSLTLT